MNAKKKKSKSSNINAEREALKADIRKKLKKPTEVTSQKVSDDEKDDTIFFDEKEI